ncbi:MAG TPA: zinc-dependent metalloprotease [Pseudonocardia sp.]|jgi:putative hydrolase|uniref:zinc-dependent metalloprotease n=1 Tax=Pseudonocardia sp. TaxID=60912 RepID=UPI002F3FABF3
MNDTPFGFGPTDRGKDDDPDRDKNREPGSGGTGASSDGPKDPFGLGAGGMGAIPGMPGGFALPGMPAGGGPGGNFDMGQLGQMLSQLGQMLSQAGSSAGPVNYDLAKQIAVQQLASSQRPTADQRKAVTDAFALAELWLNPATTFPTGARTVHAWSAKDWVEASMPTWQQLCDPVAQRVSGAWLEGLPEEARQVAGPMLAMLGQMGGMAFGSQLGAGLAQLGTEMLTSTDVGIPLGPAGTAALLPAAVEAFTTGLDRPSSEVMVYLAAREAAHHRLFSHVPWLQARVLGAIEEYAKGIRVDSSRIEEIASQIDPSDPASLENAMQSGLFEPPKTPEQFAALKRLETLLALVEGWVDVVVDDAVGERLPGADALRETLRRRRASGGPAEQTFATLVGLELRPRRLRAAAELWRTLTTERGADGRDAVWAHPDLIPTEEDLDDPKAFAFRAQDDSSDPIAELERTEQAEREAKAQDTKTQRDASTEREKTDTDRTTAPEDGTDGPSRGSNVSHDSDAKTEADKNNPPSTGSA